MRYLEIVDDATVCLHASTGHDFLVKEKNIYEKFTRLTSTFSVQAVFRNEAIQVTNNRGENKESKYRAAVGEWFYIHICPNKVHKEKEGCRLLFYFVRLFSFHKYETENAHMHTGERT